jgi:hypothetical protein
MGMAAERKKQSQQSPIAGKNIMTVTMENPMQLSGEFDQWLLSRRYK